MSVGILLDSVGIPAIKYRGNKHNVRPNRNLCCYVDVDQDGYVGISRAILARLVEIVETNSTSTLNIDLAHSLIIIRTTLHFCNLLYNRTHCIIRLQSIPYSQWF